MRILTLLLGMAAATGATAGEIDTRHLESDAVTAQFVYQARFGGAPGVPAARGFALQIAGEGQRLAGVAPFRAEYRQDTGQFLLNGIDVERAFVARQEEGGFASALGGWVPLIIVIGAATAIIVDGQDQDDP